MAKEFVSSIKKNWLALLIVFSFTLIAAGWFYWFQWRPAQIRSKCQIGWTGKDDFQKFSEGDSVGLEDLMSFEKLADSIYVNCLNKHGLKE